MQEEGLPPETVRFIGAHIESISQLELLLLLGESVAAMRAEEANEKLRSNLASVENALASLAARGLVAEVESPGGKSYRYAPSSEAVAMQVAKLAELYRIFPVRVVTAIYSAPNPMRSFADAFRIREDPKSNG